MSDGENTAPAIDLRRVAAITAVVIGVVAVAALFYLLIDVLLVLFIGVVVAAALQPWHAGLCRWGAPKGLAVLLIYVWLLTALAVIVVLVGPVFTDQLSTVVGEVPGNYANLRSWLRVSGSAPLHLLGQRLPPFEGLTRTLTGAVPRLSDGIVGWTKSIVELPFYFVTVLAVGFYWTMEVPRFERLILSLVAVERRPAALNVWHEIEAKLGGFVRGQLVVMLSVGTLAALGYALIGLPHVLTLGVLAGLFEAVPMIGPLLGFIPAVFVAFGSGLQTVVLVVGFAVCLQMVESNVLIPRIMHRAVGVSSLVGLLAVLAFGTLYGIIGVLIAIPATAVIQVVLERMIVSAEPLAATEAVAASPWDHLRMRMRAVRQHARARIRRRTSRMGIDPDRPDHVADAADQMVEAAANRAEELIEVAAQPPVAIPSEAQAGIVERLEKATEDMEQALESAAVEAQPQAASWTAEAASPAAAAVEGTPATAAESTSAVTEIDGAASRFNQAVARLEKLVASVQAQSRRSQAR